jgi:hypothetical protein
MELLLFEPLPGFDPLAFSVEAFLQEITNT